MKVKRIVITMLAGGLLLVLLVGLSMAQGSTSRALQSRPEPSVPFEAQVDSEMQAAQLDQELAPALATDLRISIPDFPLQKWYNGLYEDGTRGERILNLWNYTTYDDGPLGDLTYEPSSPNATGYLAFDIVNGHFLSMTVTTRLEKLIDMTVRVSDGTLIADGQFVVTIVPGPRIDFYEDYAGFPVPNPLVVAAGQSLEEPIDLEYYSWHEGGESIIDPTYTVISSPPKSLGVEIYTDPKAGPFDCEYCMNIHPTNEAIGTHKVEVQFENSYGLTATDTIKVKVINRVFLPLTVRNH